DDDTEMFAQTFASQNAVHDLGEIVRNLRNQDHVGSAGYSGLNGDPAGMAADDLDDDHTVMALCRGMQLVPSFTSRIQRSVETKCHDSAANVVVNRLWNTDKRHAEFIKLLGDAERSIAADHDQRIEAQFSEVGNNRTGNIALHRAAGFDAHGICKR